MTQSHNTDGHRAQQGLAPRQVLHALPALLQHQQHLQPKSGLARVCLKPAPGTCTSLHAAAAHLRADPLHLELPDSQPPLVRALVTDTTPQPSSQDSADTGRRADGGTRAARDDGPLIAAAKRHVKSQLGLDLSPCQHWLRCCEVHFSRPGPIDVPEIPEVPAACQPPCWALSCAACGCVRVVCAACQPGAVCWTRTLLVTLAPSGAVVRRLSARH